MKRIGVSALVLLAAAVVATGVNAAATRTIHGTSGDDVIHGTAKADVIYGGVGDDTIFGGKGNDVIYAGAGADRIYCGPGRDVAVVDDADLAAKDCEKVKHVDNGSPPPPPDLPTLQTGHYAGTTSQGRPFSFDIGTPLDRVQNIRYEAEQPCDNPDETLTFSGGFVWATLTRDYAFAASWTGKDNNLGQLSTVTIKATVDTNGGASGTLQVHTDADLSDAGVVHCDSGTVTWTAHVQQDDRRVVHGATCSCDDGGWLTINGVTLNGLGGFPTTIRVPDASYGHYTGTIGSFLTLRSR